MSNVKAYNLLVSWTCHASLQEMQSQKLFLPNANHQLELCNQYKEIIQGKNAFSITPPSFFLHINESLCFIDELSESLRQAGL